LFYSTCTGGKDNNKNKEERYFIKVDKSSLSLDVNTKTNNQL